MPAIGQNQPKHEPFFTIPFRQDPDFVDRGDILDQLHERGSQPAAHLALVGLEGVEYAAYLPRYLPIYRNGADYVQASLSLPSNIPTKSERGPRRPGCSGCTRAPEPDSRKATRSLRTGLGYLGKMILKPIYSSLSKTGSARRVMVNGL